MNRSSQPRRGRGRPRREYRIRVRAERRETPDYDKLARALLEHAAMQAKATPAAETSVDRQPTVCDEHEVAPPHTTEMKGGGDE